MEHNFTLDELNAKRLEIEAQIEAVRLEQKNKAIAQIKDIITANNIKAADFGSVLADLGVVWTEVKDKKPKGTKRSGKGSVAVSTDTTELDVLPKG